MVDASSQATPLDPMLADAGATDLYLIARREAPGMVAMGPVFGGNFATGPVLEQPLELEPNKGYTIIATAAGLQFFDVAIVLNPGFGNPPVELAIASAEQGTCVLGGRGESYIWPAPLAVAAKIVITATRGEQGIVIAQVFVPS